LLWQSQRLAEERDLARLEALRSEAVLNYLLMMFRDAGADASEGQTLRAKDVLDQAVSHIEQEFARDPALRQVVLATLGEMYVYLNDFTGAEPLLQRFEQLEDGSSPPALRAQVRGDLALMALRQGQGELACSRVAEGFAELQHSAADTRSLRSDLLGLQGQCLRLLGKVPDSLRAYEEALDLRRAVDGNSTRRTASAENNLALAYLQAGRSAEALAHLEIALEIFDLSGYSKSSHAANTLNNLAALALSMGQLERAMAHFDRALAVRRLVSGDSAALGALLSNQGRLFTLLDRFDEADASLSEALRLQRSFTGEDSLDTLSVRLAWGDLLLARGDAGQAAREFDAVRTGFERRFGAEHPYSARSQIALARAWAGQNRQSQSESLFEQAIGSLRTAGAGGTLFLGPALCQRGELALQQGRAAQAEVLAAECLALLAERVDETHWDVLTGRALLAAARHRQQADAAEAGRHAEAVQQLAARLGSGNRLVKKAQAWL
jgi:tetratricopeptide (TPR) repeat protein